MSAVLDFLRLVGITARPRPAWLGVGAWFGVVSALAAGSGCNMVTGADRVEYGDDDGGGSGQASAAGAGGGVTTGAGPATSGQGAGPAIGPTAPADGVAITSIALYQGVKRPLMQGGVPQGGVPVVANRDALLRIFYSLDGFYTGAPVIARVTLGDQAPLEVSATLSGVSADGSLASTVNLAIPGAMIQPGTSYRVELLQDATATSGLNASAVYPASGQETLGVQSVGSQLRLVLVPVIYGGDGSNRAPDTSAEQLERYRETLYQLFPVPRVEVQVRSAVQWNSSIQSNGSGWDALLDAMIDLRQSDNAAADEYYYGIFASASSFNQYCNFGCVTGLSLLGGPNDAYSRVGIGVGFTGRSSAETAAHEIGHQHGRGHAPCDTGQGVDPSYPYSDGGIGSWGYDLVSQQLINPAQHADFMGYCNDVWVSDYNFQNLFNRIKLVNNAALFYPGDTLNQVYERVSIGADDARWLAPAMRHTPPSAEPTTVTVTTASGSFEVTGHYYPHSHIPGGMLLFEQLGEEVLSVAVEVDGQARHIVR